MLHNLALEEDGVPQSCPGGRWCSTILPWRKMVLPNLALEVDGVTQSCPGGRWCYTIHNLALEVL